MASRVTITCHGPNGIIVNGDVTMAAGTTRAFDVHDATAFTIDDAVAPATQPAWVADLAATLETMDGKLDTIVTQTEP